MTSVKYKTHDKKIHWYGNTIHRQWCETLRNIQINENIQKYYLQEIIYKMCPTEAYTITCRRFLSEGKTSRHDIVKHKTDNITYSEGY